jgi:hypothetical protein
MYDSHCRIVRAAHQIGCEVPYELGGELRCDRHELVLEVLHHLVHGEVEQIEVGLLRQAQEVYPV